MNNPDSVVAAAVGEQGDHLPFVLVYVVLAICALPLLLYAFGVDLGSARSPSSGFSAGPLVHTLLEWTAVCFAAFIVSLSFFHYLTERDVVTPVIDMALTASGAVDTFHVLAANHVISSATENQDFIPFTWALSRQFNAAVMLVVPAIVVLSKQKPRSRGPGFVCSIGMGLGSLALVVMWMCTTSRSLPRTQFPDALITRPYDIAPILFYLTAALFVYPRLVRRCPGGFSQVVFLSAILPPAVHRRPRRAVQPASFLRARQRHRHSGQTHRFRFLDIQALARERPVRRRNGLWIDDREKSRRETRGPDLAAIQLRRRNDFPLHAWRSRT